MIKKLNKLLVSICHLDKARDKMRNKLRIAERLYVIDTLLRNVISQILRFIDESANILFTWKQSFAQRVHIKYDATMYQKI